MKVTNQSDVKQKNRNLLLKLIITNAPISRIELAKITGLTKMSVSNLVAELIVENLVEETGVANTSVGRKPIGLEVCKNAAVILGVYISRDEIHTFAGDLSGNILCNNYKTIESATRDTLPEMIMELLDNIIEQVSSFQIIGMGISSVGPLDYKRGIILNPPNFHNIHDLDLVSILKNKYKMQVFIDNDMNTSGLAEKYFGKAKNLKNFIYMGVTNGIGAGIIIDHKLYAGDQGFSGEIGHITVNIDGLQCTCGNTGCLEMYASLPKNFKQLTYDEQQKKVHDIGRYLAAGIVTLVNLFDPEQIFLGHDIAVVGEPVSKLLNKLTEGKYLTSGNKSVNVHISHFIDKSPIKGAIALCIDRLFES